MNFNSIKCDLIWNIKESNERQEQEKEGTRKIEKNSENIMTTTDGRTV